MTLTPEQATKQVRVMEVENAKAGAYQVTIKYVDENGNLLWSDAVDVKGKGYQYTLPNSFSMSAVAAANNEVTTDREKGSWGVSYYTLASWSIATNPSNDNEAIQAQSSESTEDDPVVSFDAGEYPAGRTVTAVYQSQATTKEVNLTIVEINGETGATIDKVNYTVTPEQSATYNCRQFHLRLGGSGKGHRCPAVCLLCARGLHAGGGLRHYRAVYEHREQPDSP